MNVREDYLTPRERAKAFSEGGPMDRIICLPMVAISAAYLVGKTICYIKSHLLTISL